jgi:dGTPase
MLVASHSAESMPFDPQSSIPARSVAPYAVDATRSLGRLHAEPVCPMRTPFQRDRDRIVHATAFRRLNYKTQVFLFHEGDHYRSRLTHSLEVAQIARAIARLLSLDEDLAEALALAHDVGHFGGFDHNAQSLRVVTRLERKYARFDGLNLSIETLDGLVKHNGPVSGPHARDAEGDVVLRAAIAEAGLADRLDLDHFASAEAQAAAVADDIAWTNHDIDDGLRAGLLAITDLTHAPLAGGFVRDVLVTGTEERRAIYEVNRRMITAMIAGCVEEARVRLAALPAASIDRVRHAGRSCVAFPAAMARDLDDLKTFLFARVYRHPRISRVMDNAETIVTELFARYRDDPTALPDGRGEELLQLADEAQQARRLGDFIAGMTDRFAIAEHQRLFDATPELR